MSREAALACGRFPEPGERASDQHRVERRVDGRVTTYGYPSNRGKGRLRYLHLRDFRPSGGFSKNGWVMLSKREGLPPFPWGPVSWRRRTTSHGLSMNSVSLEGEGWGEGDKALISNPLSLTLSPAGGEGNVFLNGH